MTNEPTRGAIILCGGKSSRMGSDKATLPFGRESMLQRVIRILSQVIPLPSIVVVTAPDQVIPTLPSSIRVTCDERPERGPLEGLSAGWKVIAPKVQVAYATSCDVPLLVPEFVKLLFDLLGDHDISIPVEGGFHHPLAAVYRSNVHPTIRRLLDEDQLRPRSLIDHHPAIEVTVDRLRGVDPNLTSLMNLNTPEAYSAALSYAKSHGDPFVEP